MLPPRNTRGSRRNGVISRVAGRRSGAGMARLRELLNVEQERAQQRGRNNSLRRVTRRCARYRITFRRKPACRGHSNSSQAVPRSFSFSLLLQPNAISRFKHSNTQANKKTIVGKPFNKTTRINIVCKKKRKKRKKPSRFVRRVK